MNHQEMNAWRDGLYLNFGSIREAKRFYDMMVARYEQISAQVDALLAKSKEGLKGELKPIYLHRSSDSAAKSLKWKLSSAKCFGFSKSARTYSLLTKDVLQVLRSAQVNEGLIDQVIEMDFKRCYLNYALNYSYHEMMRVKLFIENSSRFSRV